MILVTHAGGKKVSKKKSRQAPGVSSFALQEAHDIFGDVDELLRLRKQGLAKMGKHVILVGGKRGLKMNSNQLSFLRSI